MLGQRRNADFRTLRTRQEDRATWTVQAYRELWLPDGQVLAVTPFLLAGAQWWPKGFPWIAQDGTTLLPVYNATRQLRCHTVGGHDCD